VCVDDCRDSQHRVNRLSALKFAVVDVLYILRFQAYNCECVLSLDLASPLVTPIGR
jgi:hypothetical protein